MDPDTGHDGSVESAVDLMLSPEIGGRPLPSEEPVEETAEVEQPETEATEEEYDPPEEETPEVEEPESRVDDDVEDVESPDAQEKPGDRYRVKVDGQEVEVSLEELKQGYSGQQYVQKGMQEAAAARKEAEEIYTALQNERQQVANYIQQIQAGIKPPPVEPDKALFESDPISYMEQKIRYDEEAAQYGMQMQQLQEVTAKQSEADKAAMHTYLQGELKQLQAIDPDFRERETAEKARAEMTTLGNEIYGYSADELNQIVDHRAIRVLRDAIKYQNIVKGKAKAQETAEAEAPTPKTIKKGKPVKRATTRSSRRRKQKDRLKQTGSLDDALSLMFE